MGLGDRPGKPITGPVTRFRTTRAQHRRWLLVSVVAGGSAVAAVMVVALVFFLPENEQVQTGSTMASTTTSVTSHTIPVVVIHPQPVVATTQAAHHVVVIDPGHQARPNGEQEPFGPGANRTKDKVSSGTKSINTGAPESALVLSVSLKLRDSLMSHGIEVVMTRATEDVDLSNIQRAQIANEAQADLFVRIHADGATDTSIHGILMLYPATIEGWTDDIASESARAAQLALDSLAAATGTRSRGLIARSDLTGFNWSDVPVILPEIGLMTNREEDALLATGEYQDKIVQGLTEAILDYLGVS